ncbi:TonB-dependent receptor [Methylovorus menthalis]|uniref:TonB-dependent receptor n=1 Tax=Methylovorus menthalis TaxID=1002227 RepID=UPI001E4BDD01|nr:TonB-dependent receptor [Methylovorus menthalis]MCB4810687.1 TonB-dependent receptor [Methylovorus menthalis]
MNKTILASTIGLLFTTSVYAEEEKSVDIDTVIVTANRLERKDTETTYASEVHTQEMIQASGATNLYDYLAQHTSITTLPNFGNKATPSIDMRGYGNANGYQNIVVSVDGQRLNNIDSSPQLIGGIPLNNIDRIEITKGSGSVVYGDGAMAGTIQIYTKTRTGVSVSASVGNFGSKTGNISAGISEQYFDLSASASDDSNDGYSKKDSTGKKDSYASTAQNIKLGIKPMDGLRFNVEGTSSRTDIRYVNSLTRAQFRDDPRQNGSGSAYTHQGLDSDQWRVGVEYQLNNHWKFNANRTREDKRSEFINFGSKFDYDYLSHDVTLTYQSDLFSVVGGLQTFEGERRGASDRTTKDNTAAFIQTELHLEALTLSAGTRREKVEYDYKPTGAAGLDDSDKLGAWDLGMNYRFNQQASVFANYNKAYQAPDIDRFFTFFGTFNSFITPARARTLNVGFNHVVEKNRLKITLFQSRLDDEIYYNASTFTNTNIDKSHKYGLEFQDQFQVTDNISTSLIYTYTRAIIDREADGNGTFNGKELPGVSRNGVVANLGYRFYENAYLNLSHVWRSSTYSADDFANNLTQKQNSYESTNLALSYKIKNVQLFTALNNIFEHKNSIQVRDDAIYPVDFSRTWRVGMKADF